MDKVFRELSSPITLCAPGKADEPCFHIFVEGQDIHNNMNYCKISTDLFQMHCMYSKYKTTVCRMVFHFYYIILHYDYFICSKLFTPLIVYLKVIFKFKHGCLKFQWSALTQWYLITEKSWMIICKRLGEQASDFNARKVTCCDRW